MSFLMSRSLNSLLCMKESFEHSSMAEVEQQLQDIL